MFSALNARSGSRCVRLKKTRSESEFTLSRTRAPNMGHSTFGNGWQRMTSLSKKSNPSATTQRPVLMAPSHQGTSGGPLGGVEQRGTTHKPPGPPVGLYVFIQIPPRPLPLWGPDLSFWATMGSPERRRFQQRRFVSHQQVS